MSRKDLALARGVAGEVSGRLEGRGISLAPTTILSALNYARGGKSGRPLRSHRSALALIQDPAIAELGLCLNDVLDPPVAPDVRVFEWDNDSHLAARSRSHAEYQEGAA